MDKQFILLAVVAIIGIGVMTFAGFDSSVTGEQIKIVKLPVQQQQEIPIVQLPVKSQETQKIPILKIPVTPSEPVYTTKSGSLDTCQCEDMYGGNIITKKEGGQILAGTSYHDCMLYNEIIKLRKELNLKIDQFNMVSNICKNRGWWPG